MRAPYDIHRSTRAQRMRIAVYPDGVVKITVPQHASPAEVEEFISHYAPWVEAQMKRHAGRPVIYAEKRLIAAYKTQAKSFAAARCAHFAKILGVRYTKISIRAQKSRWGSCSRAGSLSFNYRIALLSPQLRDYIIVHELCHLRVFNHSRAFWGEVERLIPEHRQLRKELRSTAFRFA